MTLDIHIGAHKTATTFIQQTLRKNVDALEAVGTCFLSPREFRYMHEENWNDGDIKDIHDFAAADPKSAEIALDPERRLLMSDENLLGRAVPFYHANTLYPEVKRRFEMVKKLLPCAPDHVYFCIRNYVHFYPAIYYQFASQSNFLPIDDVLQDRLIAKPRRWPEIVNDLQSVFPTSKIVVWLYEDFSVNQAKLLHVLANGAELKYNTNSRPRPTVSGSAYDAWVVAKNRIDKYPDFTDRFSKWVKNADFVAPSNDISFAKRFWRKSDVEALNVQYNADIAELSEGGFLMDLGKINA